MNLERIQEILRQAYREEEYPVCLSQQREWSKSKPFNGMTILDATPVFRNTMVKYLALLAGGANLIVGTRHDGSMCDKRIVSLLRDSGFTLVSNAEAPTCQVDFVLDCAAQFSHWDARLGYVEITRSGVPVYQRQGKTVFVADAGRIKKIETSLGTGESYFRAMGQMGYKEWGGKKVVVAGSGKVGTGIITYAGKYGADVTVVTQPDTVSPSVKNLATQIIDCRDANAVAAAVAHANAVVTATGVANAMGNPIVAKALMESDALLANMGVEDEYGPAIPADRVLQGKRPINFILEEPTHLKYIDATMGLHNQGAEYLLEHPDATGVINPPAELEESLLDLTRRKGCISRELEMSHV